MFRNCLLLVGIYCITLKSNASSSEDVLLIVEKTDWEWKEMKCYSKNYPRPQFVRRDWESLNGMWDFSFDDENCGEAERWYDSFPAESKICVPFSYETKMSGIGETSMHRNIWYHRSIQITEKMAASSLMLHFEGCDYVTRLWINGSFVGSHRGGYARFSFDISNYVHVGENEIVVKAEDSFDMQQPRGKQRWIGKNYACWYEQTTGIWKTVWMEWMSPVHLENVKMTPDIGAEQIEMEVTVSVPEEKYEKAFLLEAEVSFQGVFVTSCCMPVGVNRVNMKLNLADYHSDREEAQTIRLWTPGNPNLYDVKFRLYYERQVLDEVDSYFGMREIEIDRTRILLNGHPVYQRLVLDQGYWKYSGLTAPDEDALIEDIDKILELGYNGVRIHQKTEDERFLYWCDVKGVLTWCEMPSAYRYTDKMLACFTEEWLEIVKQHENHPSVIVWTVFNESWGIDKVRTDVFQQHFTQAVYHLTKSVDRQKRPVIVNDGWDHTVSDIVTLHDYEQDGEILEERYVRFWEELLEGKICFDGRYHTAAAQGFSVHGKPVVISEFGGIAFRQEEEGLGYGEKAEDQDAFLRRFERITMSIKAIPGVIGYCYTQATDVQQEKNGLMDAERKFKIPAEKIREINERSIGCWQGYGSL